MPAVDRLLSSGMRLHQDAGFTRSACENNRPWGSGMRAFRVGHGWKYQVDLAHQEQHRATAGVVGHASGTLVGRGARPPGNRVRTVNITAPDGPSVVSRVSRAPRCCKHKKSKIPPDQNISPGQWHFYSCRRREACKTVGSAYVGSNPTPATTCEDGPLAANSRG